MVQTTCWPIAPLSHWSKGQDGTAYGGDPRSQLEFPVIDLRFVPNRDRPIYQTALAHRVAAQQSIPVVAIAQSLQQYMLRAVASLPSLSVEHAPWGQGPYLSLQNCQFRTTSSHYLQCELGDRAIALWLQAWLESSVQSACSPASNAQSAFDPDPRALFQLQYTHARCCSLLRQAAQARLITLQPRSPVPRLRATAIPWLDAQGQLYTHTRPERALIHCLFTVFDSFDPTAALSLQQTWQLAQSLAQATQAVHQHCQLFGAMQAESRDRGHAYLGLMAITQQVFYHLLEEKFYCVAPTEL